VRIDSSAFADCTSLTRIDFPERLKTIGPLSFARCAQLATITCKPYLTTIQCGAYSETALHEVAFPASLKRIGKLSFLHCQRLSRLTFAYHARTVIEHCAFAETAVQKVTLPRGCEVDPQFAFPPGCTVDWHQLMPPLLSDHYTNPVNDSWTVAPVKSDDQVQRLFFRFVEDWIRIANPWTAKFKGFTFPTDTDPGLLVFAPLPGAQLSEVMASGGLLATEKVMAIVAILRMLMALEQKDLHYRNYWPSELRFDNDVLKAQWMAPAVRPAGQLFAAMMQRIIDGEVFPGPDEVVEPGKGLSAAVYEKCQTDVPFSQIWELLSGHNFALLDDVDAAAVTAFVARVEGPAT
jgi:hypothetical protein